MLCAFSFQSRTNFFTYSECYSSYLSNVCQLFLAEVQLWEISNLVDFIERYQWKLVFPWYYLRNSQILSRDTCYFSRRNTLLGINFYTWNVVCMKLFIKFIQQIFIQQIRYRYIIFYGLKLLSFIFHCTAFLIVVNIFTLAFFRQMGIRPKVKTKPSKSTQEDKPTINY